MRAAAMKNSKKHYVAQNYIDELSTLLVELTDQQFPSIVIDSKAIKGLVYIVR